MANRKNEREDPFNRLAMGSIILQGLIIDPAPEQGTYKVYIPNLLPTIDGSVTEDRESKIESQNLLDSAKNGDIKVTESNSLILGAYSLVGMGDTKFKKNDVVSIMFPDRDINSAMILPFRPTGIRSGPSLGMVSMIANAIKLKKDKKKLDIPVSKNNSYGFEIDAEKKIVSIFTSNDNGEKFTYEINLDPGSSVLNIRDSAGNHIQFLSESKGVLMGNSQGSAIGLIGNKIQITADEVEINSKSYKLRTNTEYTKAKSSEYETNMLKEKISIRDTKIDSAKIDITNTTISGAKASLGTTNINVTSSMIDGSVGTILKMMKTQFGTNPLAYADMTGVHAGMTQTPVADSAGVVAALMTLAGAIDSKQLSTPGVVVGAIGAQTPGIISPTITS